MELETCIQFQTTLRYSEFLLLEYFNKTKQGNNKNRTIHMWGYVRSFRLTGKTRKKYNISFSLRCTEVGINIINIFFLKVL